ncbi:hypothetical protein N234_31540 [Ralstonia pickettii DTP0602]|nr:hypothetical protein N234_31540 [Ralstonia pickettii DTP0602]
MQLFLLGVNALLLMVIWRFMLRKTILDHHRDKLFDLRDQLRATFMARGWDLNSPMYRKLRNLTNGYLRFTEEFAFVPFVALENELKAKPALQRSLKSAFDQEFSTRDDQLRKFVDEYRLAAREVMIGYMICSSGPLLFTAVLIAPFVALCEVAKALSRGLVRGIRVIAAQTANFEASVSTSFDRAAKAVATRLFVPDFVEEYSYRMGIDPHAPSLAAA